MRVSWDKLGGGRIYFWGVWRWGRGEGALDNVRKVLGKGEIDQGRGIYGWGGDVYSNDGFI